MSSNRKKKSMFEQTRTQDTIKFLEIESAKEIVDQMFAILDGLEGAVYVSDMETYRIIRVNKYVKEHYGSNVLGKKCFKVFQKGYEKPCPFCTNSRLIIDGKPASPVVWDFHNTKTGRWYQCIDKAIQWPDGRIVRMEIAIDITDRKNSEIALRESEKFHNTIFESINDPFNIIDNDFRIIKANESYARMRGKRVDDIIGKRCYEVLQNRNSICENCSVNETFKSGEPKTKEKFVNFPDGLRGWIEIYTYPIFDEKGRVYNVIEYTRDITQRKRAEAERDVLIDKLQYLYRVDDLTGLLNRRALLERLEQEAYRSKRYGSKLSLIICDIDYFKTINDSFGHDIGDKVLRRVSTLLVESLRTTDIIGRYGGDEFFMILPETSMEGAREIAERIRSFISDFEFNMGGSNPIKTSVSLGIAEFNPLKEDIEDLIKRADNALYMAKDKGRDRIYIIS